MNNETQNTIQKIEDSLARQNYDYSQHPDPVKKLIKAIWLILGLVLLITTIITVTGWLTIEENPTTSVYNTQDY